MSFSVKMCSLNNLQFLFFSNSKFERLICIYVDDFLWADTRVWKFYYWWSVEKFVWLGALLQHFLNIFVTIFVCGGTWGVNQKNWIANYNCQEVWSWNSGKKNRKCCDRVFFFLLTMAKIETKKLTGTED